MPDQAAGGIRTLEAAEALFEAGADRIGTSMAEDILMRFRERPGQGCTPPLFQGIAFLWRKLRLICLFPTSACGQHNTERSFASRRAAPAGSMAGETILAIDDSPTVRKLTETDPLHRGIPNHHGRPTGWKGSPRPKVEKLQPSSSSTSSCPKMNPVPGLQGDQGNRGTDALRRSSWSRRKAKPSAPSSSICWGSGNT